MVYKYLNLGTLLCKTSSIKFRNHWKINRGNNARQADWHVVVRPCILTRAKHGR
ncbi:hypothetical protein Hanom_Chr02g00116161 [Helianthus anomalus]